MHTNTTIGIVLTVYNIICITFDAFSYVFYIMFLSFLIRSLLKKDPAVSSSFFIIVTVNGILDILFLAEEYFIYRIPETGFLEEFYTVTLPGSLIAGMCYTYYICQLIYIALSGITLTFNRLFAIQWPHKYQQFWSGWRLFLFIIWPFFITVPLFSLYYDSKVDYSKDEAGRLTCLLVDPAVHHVLYTSVITTHTLALIVNGTLNTILIFKLKKRIKNSTNYNHKEKKNTVMEKFALLNFLFFIFAVSIEVAMDVASHYGEEFLYANFLSAFAIVESLLIFFTPYALLFLSKEIRGKFFSFIGLRRQRIVDVGPTTNRVATFGNRSHLT
uniref:Serpentine receptor class gamma n=1 Tax=Parastrongyloides trichosuri TaxID=131310 RepID=A0A0N4ZM10_PARTI